MIYNISSVRIQIVFTNAFFNKKEKLQSSVGLLTMLLLHHRKYMQTKCNLGFKKLDRVLQIRRMHCLRYIIGTLHFCKPVFSLLISPPDHVRLSPSVVSGGVGGSTEKKAGAVAANGTSGSDFYHLRSFKAPH